MALTFLLSQTGFTSRQKMNMNDINQIGRQDEEFGEDILVDRKRFHVSVSDVHEPFANTVTD